MGKRFTATEKWDDPWYRKLPCEYRDLWQFILDKCDNSGVWTKDFETASYYIGKPIDEKEAITQFNHEKNRIILLNAGKYWLISDFVRFQFGNINTDSKTHIHVRSLIERHRVSKGYPKGIDTLEDKDKVKDIVKDKDIDMVLDQWNERMPWKIKEISGSRLTHTKERLREPQFVNEFHTILTKILESDFLSGRKPSKDHPNFRADFDWIIKNNNNYIKVLEDRYAKREVAV